MQIDGYSLDAQKSRMKKAIYLGKFTVVNKNKLCIGFFYGWYLKCQSDTQTLAVIPAVHRAGRKSTCSIQIITDDEHIYGHYRYHIMEGKRVQVGYLSGGESCPNPKRKCLDCAARTGNEGFSFGSGRASFEYEYGEL